MNESADEVKLKRDMISDILKIKKWIVNNRLTLNVNKSKYMLFKCNISSDFKLYYDFNNIEKVKNFRYLGFMLDSKLNFKNHCETLRNKISSVAGCFRRISCYMHLSTKRSLFFAFFNSIVNYGIELYGTAAKYLINELQVIQNKAIKNLFCLDRFQSTYLIHLNNKILPIHST